MSKSFVDELDEGSLELLSSKLCEYSRADVERVLSSGAHSLEDFAILISPSASQYLEDMAQLSANITQSHFGKTMRLFAPLYISNDCINNCKYCGFASRHKIKRQTLSEEEIAQEIDAIYDLGFRNVLLVASEHPRLIESGYIERAVQISAKKMSSVSLEIAPSSVEVYADMVKAGANGLTVFQESYSRQTYAQMHQRGPKADFNWRLLTPERAYQAGMRNLGLGALLGLNDWGYEILALASHAKYLFKNAWKAQISVSLPRIRPAEGDFKPQENTLPSDRQLVQILFAFRIYLSRVGIVLSTREPSKLRDGLMGLGATQMSIYSSTRPGGYAHRTQSGAQFDIDDNRDVPTFLEALRQKGIDPIWKDFDMSFM